MTIVPLWLIRKCGDGTNDLNIWLVSWFSFCYFYLAAQAVNESKRNI